MNSHHFVKDWLLEPTEFKAEFPPIDEFFSQQEGSVCLDGIHYLSSSEEREHTLIIGASGAGKTTRTLVQTCHRENDSLIINDPSAELAKILSPYYRRTGRVIRTLNLTNPYQGDIFWNPLFLVKTPKDVMILSRFLVRSISQEEDGEQTKNGKHWIDKASSYLTSFIHLVLKLEPEKQTLGEVYHLMQKAILDPDEIEDLFIQKEVEPRYLLTFQAALKNKTNELSNIQSTASRAVFQFSYENETVYEVTSKQRNNIDFQDLRKERMVIFIHGNPDEINLFDQTVALFLEQIALTTASAIPGDSEQTIVFVAEEAATLPLIGLHKKIPRYRKRRFSFILVYQSLEQLLDSQPGKQGRVITKNSRTKIFIGAQEEDTAKELEQAIGRYKAPGSETGLLPRKAAEEIRMWPDDVVLVMQRGKTAILTRSTPYYEHSKFKHLPRRKHENSNEYVLYCNDRGCMVPA